MESFWLGCQHGCDFSRLQRVFDAELFKAMSNVKELEARGCKVLHEVDVHSISQHPFLIREKGFRIILEGFHQDLVRGFLKNACEMLTAIGEIHVTHKTTFPFSEWKIVELAKEVGLYLVDEEQFSLLDYPGYENKRGAGMCDKTFHVGMCSTFKFAKLLYSSTTSWSGCFGINGPHMQRDEYLGRVGAYATDSVA
ncbi:hypothetical protein Prudu_011724 [Prunus dulcis]|uniref:25S rRNA (uridine-N(3))-methyltransferase BMT5-like domain-containing protein n=1 Tax=Prunus dulcis TaxID=3755 RepID=A0A4Y1RBD3_PRUDU|nr:hypothetical protein Prudu_011724 [Prunus dulcis]